VPTRVSAGNRRKQHSRAGCTVWSKERPIVQSHDELALRCAQLRRVRIQRDTQTFRYLLSDEEDLGIVT
jgi:hypothetical protein